MSKIFSILIVVFLFLSLSIATHAGQLPKNEAIKQIKQKNSDVVVIVTCFEQSSFPGYSFYNLDNDTVKKICDNGLGTLLYRPLDSRNVIKRFSGEGSKYLGDRQSNDPKEPCKEIQLAKISKINISGIRSFDTAASVEFEFELNIHSPFGKILLKNNKITGTATFDKYDDGWRFSSANLEKPFQFSANK
jgi:hypothetical protein